MVYLVQLVESIVILYISHCSSNGEIISYKYMQANGEEFQTLDSGISIACAEQCSDEPCIGISLERKEPRHCLIHMRQTVTEHPVDYTDPALFVTWLRPGK